MIFDSPNRIDRTATQSHATPRAWTTLDVKEVQVIPLSAASGGNSGRPGWCSYESYLQGPEFEIFCGGINTKAESAAGLWRQGFLLHFGFDLSPAGMTEAGRSMLVNAIVYISRFKHDRPIIRVRSGFSGKGTRPRETIRRWLNTPEYPVTWFERFFAPGVLDGVSGDGNRGAYDRWLTGVFDYLRADDEGKMLIDEEARRLQAPPGGDEFFDKAIDCLAEPAKADAAKTLLLRYAPAESNPPIDGDPAAWRAWHKSNRPYLFYSEPGGYRWYLDTLARERGQRRPPRPAARRPLAWARRFGSKGRD